MNITDTFTRMYGRPPTESELGSLYKLKLEQDLLRRLNKLKPEPVQLKKKKPKPEPVQLKKKKLPRPSRLTRTINKLMLYLLTDDQIVDALGITRKEFDAQVKKYTLPNLKLDGGQPKFK